MSIMCLSYLLFKLRHRTKTLTYAKNNVINPRAKGAKVPPVRFPEATAMIVGIEDL